MNHIFENRKEAGALLAAQINRLPKKDLENSIILALPRGGVPVAYEISKKTQIPMDVLIVRKIGHPLYPEYGIGAVTEDGFDWMDPNASGLSEVTFEQINKVITEEKNEVDRRMQVYRNGKSLSSLKGKTVILVDDGLATGATARVATMFVKSKGAKKVILAVAVCSNRTAVRLHSEADEVISLEESRLFFGVGQFYKDFSQLTDDEVIEFLEKARKQSAPHKPELNSFRI